MARIAGADALRRQPRRNGGARGGGGGGQHWVADLVVRASAGLHRRDLRRPRRADRRALSGVRYRARRALYLSWAGAARRLSGTRPRQTRPRRALLRPRARELADRDARRFRHCRARRAGARRHLDRTWRGRSQDRGDRGARQTLDHAARLFGQPRPRSVTFRGHRAVRIARLRGDQRGGARPADRAARDRRGARLAPSRLSGGAGRSKKSGLSDVPLPTNVHAGLGIKAGKADQILYLGSFQMRSFISKAVAGTMIAGAALALAACAKTDFSYTVTDMNFLTEITTDNMTTPDAGMMNDTTPMANDTMSPTTTTTMTPNTTGNAMKVASVAS